MADMTAEYMQRQAVASGEGTRPPANRLPPAFQQPPEFGEMARTVITNAPMIHDFLDRCEACGLPVERQREDLRGHVEFAQRYLQQFFDDTPPA